MNRAFALAATVASTFLAATFGASDASAHTVELCTKTVNGVTTFYAGTYHRNTTIFGGIIVDGFTYPFSGNIPASSLPSGVECVKCAPGYPGVVRWQTFTSSFAPASHTITFTTTSAVESPWCTFPNMTFGGGSCADADFDGICNDVDSCPLDAANDADADGKCGNVDNCPNKYNPDQKDSNGNGQGDVCEGIVCGNGLLQSGEQCDDGNMVGGDGCSAVCTTESKDADNDGVLDGSDNCPSVANSNQLNSDTDGQGDA